MSSLLRWLKAVLLWLLEARIFWLSLFVPILGIAFLAHQGTTETNIRIVGMLLQLLGILTVAWGIRETRQLFGHPSLFELSGHWIKRFPSFKPNSISVNGSIMMTLDCNARAYGVAGVSKDANIEERVIALERNITLLHERINGIQDEADHGFRKHTEALKDETNKRSKALQDVNAKLEATETGGLHISAMGALWLFVGVIMSSIPSELGMILK